MSGSREDAAGPAAEQPGVQEEQPARRTESDWERKRRLARIFGDVLPETTRDERDPEAARGPQSGDDWLRSQVPPHHGG